MGFDLNRHWVDPSPWAHPTLHGVKELIIQMYNNPVSGQPYTETAGQFLSCPFPCHFQHKPTHVSSEVCLPEFYWT